MLYLFVKNIVSIAKTRVHVNFQSNLRRHFKIRWFLVEEGLEYIDYRFDNIIRRGKQMMKFNGQWMSRSDFFMLCLDIFFVFYFVKLETYI